MAVRRNTIQRDIVLNTIRQMKTHPTADEVYQKIKEGPLKISRATVYRNLNLLSLQGDIQHIAVFGGADSFDFRVEPHYHIVCEECGRIADVRMDYLADISAKAEDFCGYEVSGYELAFKGRCPECRLMRQSKQQE